MKPSAKYDPETGAMYVRLVARRGRKVKTVSTADSTVMVDVSADDEVLGLEFLDPHTMIKAMTKAMATTPATPRESL